MPRVGKGLTKTLNFFAKELQEWGELWDSSFQLNGKEKEGLQKESDPRREGAASHQGTSRNLQWGEGSRQKTSREMEIISWESRSGKGVRVRVSQLQSSLHSCSSHSLL